MFYIDRNIETEVFFSHHDMDRASDNKEILKRLKEKVEGYCDQEYGYLIQVIANPTAVQMGIHIDRVDIRKEGIFASVKFSSITFRPSKNQILTVIVSEIHESGIMGKIGPANVMIPQLKISQQSARFKPNENAYEFFSENSDDTLAIQVGSRVLCRCFEVKVQMSSMMRIIGAIDNDLVQLSLEKDY